MTVPVRESCLICWRPLSRKPRSCRRKRRSIFFLLNGSLVGLTPQEKLILKCNFPPAERAEQTIFLNNLGSRPFTAPGRIPDAGIMKVN